MQGKRVERVNSLLRNELGQLISTRMKDVRMGFATITEVDMSPDLKSCRVLVSVIGSDKEKQGTLAALEHSEGFLKREISKTLKLRFTPELYFKLDRRVEESMKLNAAFNKIKSEETKSDDGESSEGPTQEDEN